MHPWVWDRSVLSQQCWEEVLWVNHLLVTKLVSLSENFSLGQLWSLYIEAFQLMLLRSKNSDPCTVELPCE